jgi:hypothetical protein
MGVFSPAEPRNASLERRRRVAPQTSDHSSLRWGIGQNRPSELEEKLRLTHGDRSGCRLRYQFGTGS